MCKVVLLLFVLPAIDNNKLWWSFFKYAEQDRPGSSKYQTMATFFASIQIPWNLPSVKLEEGSEKFEYFKVSICVPHFVI